MRHGKLYGVSTGPGDPELMTIKAARILREVPVIALPNGRKEACSAYQIAVQAVPEIEEKECLLIPMPMTKDPDRLEQSHQAGARQIQSCLSQGKDVALLTLGDVCVYSTCWYLYHRIREMGEEGELISGVPSFCAAAARLERTLASGSQQLHILPASYPLEEGLGFPGVKVLMKAGKQLSAVKHQLKEQGFSVCGVERCGMEGERIYSSLEEIQEDGGYYSLFIVEDKPEL